MVAAFQRKRQPPFPPKWLAPIDPRITTATAAAVANIVYLQRLERVSAPMTITRGAYLWSSIATNAAIALMTADRDVITEADATAATYTAVANSTPVAASAANAYNSITFTAPYLLLPGVDLWVAIGFDAAAVVGRTAALSGISLIAGLSVAKAAAYSSGIPASISSSLVTSAFLPTIILT